MSPTGTYVVTGGGSGIGAACAELLVASGGEVVVTGRRPQALERVAERLGCRFHVGDVSDPKDNQRLADSVGGPLAGLVHAAGIGTSHTLAETELEEWNRVLAVNLTGVYDLTRRLLNPLRAGGGAVAIVGSVAGERVPVGAAAYAVSKAAVAMLGAVIALEEGRGAHPVRCNVVLPGWTRSEMADAEMDRFAHVLGSDRERAYDEAARLVPLGRAASATEVAQSIVWLLSPAASYVNGATLNVDGGHRWVDAGTVPFDYEVRPRD